MSLKYTVNEVSPKTIWNFRQNNPELVVQDAKNAFSLNDSQCETLRIILLARGVNKWLKVRRDLIAYKKQIKHMIKQKQADIVVNKCLMSKTPYKSVGFYKLSREGLALKRGLKMLEGVRASLKSLCMTDRWQIWRPSTSRKTLREMNSLTGSGN